MSTNSAGIKDRHGRLWFGGIGGVVRIDPAAIQGNDVPPPISIEEVTAGGEERTAYAGRIDLAARERDFETAYTALSFIAPENVRFRYRLEGFNEGWVDAGGRRRAFYTNVPPGEYMFRVVASNNDGVWNEAGAAIAVTVAPFVHEAWQTRAASCSTSYADSSNEVLVLLHDRFQIRRNTHHNSRCR